MDKERVVVVYLASEYLSSEYLSKASKVFSSWKKRVFTNRQFSISTKMKIFRALVRSVLLYGWM